MLDCSDKSNPTLIDKLAFDGFIKSIIVQESQNRLFIATTLGLFVYGL
jgi:hypothetical protein